MVHLGYKNVQISHNYLELIVDGAAKCPNISSPDDFKDFIIAVEMTKNPQMMAATVDDMQAMSMSPDTKVLQMRKHEITRKMKNLI